MVKNKLEIVRFITVVFGIVTFASIGCEEKTSRKYVEEDDIQYRYIGESNLNQYESEIEEAPIPEIPGWFPKEDLFRIPEAAFDKSRSGHPWLAVATAGYVEIRNAPGYGAPRVTDSNGDDAPPGDSEEAGEAMVTERRNDYSYSSSITGSLKRAEPFWITDKTLSEASGYHWYKIESFNRKSGYVYLPRTESYQPRAFAHEKIVPPRIVISTAEASFYDGAGTEIAPARYGDIFYCKDLEIVAGELYYRIMILDFGDALIPVADCTVLAEDIFYILYLRSSKVYDYPGQFNKLEEVLRYFARVEWFLDRYPDSTNAPMVLYRANYVALAQGSSDKAEEYRKRLIENYPDEAKRLLNPEI
jgi:hypothetical protein